MLNDTATGESYFYNKNTVETMSAYGNGHYAAREVIFSLLDQIWQANDEVSWLSFTIRD